MELKPAGKLLDSAGVKHDMEVLTGHHTREIARCAKARNSNLVALGAKRRGAICIHDMRTRQMSDMIGVDAPTEVDAAIKVEVSHDIAVEAHHRVLNLMTRVDSWRRPDLAHAGPALPARRWLTSLGRSKHLLPLAG
jgi:hypothetical protein